MSDSEKSDLLQAINFRTLAEDAPCTLWLTDKEGNILFTNNQYKNFIGREKVETQGGRAWFNALHPDDRDYCLNMFKDAFETFKPFRMEYRLMRRDGEYRHFIDHGVPYISDEGQYAGFVGSSTDITEQKSSEEELMRSHHELTQYNHEMNLINHLNSYLQVCRDIEETYPIVSYYAEQIFPDCSGALYLFNDNKSIVESMTTWGKALPKSNLILAPDDCWSLRQGKEHSTFNNDERLQCKHVAKDVANYICEPIIAQGEMMGMLHIQFDARTQLDSEENENFLDSRKRLIKITADNLALSLVSLKLREALQTQSVKDPLTQLFNRRHMEESLEREIHRCARADKGLGVIMSDVDHFKRFNDEYGHDAGDAVLKAFGQLLEQTFRTSDIVCRYGGEDFIVIMPDANQDIVLERANHLCNAVRELKIMYDGEPLPMITSSFGISFIQEGIVDKKELIKAADFALYEAKQAGRDQVKVSQETFEQ